MPRHKKENGLYEGKKTAGQVLREIREEVGIGQCALARRTKVSQQHICAIENGVQSPSFNVVRRITIALGVSLEYLSKRMGKPVMGDLASVDGRAKKTG